MGGVKSGEKWLYLQLKAAYLTRPAEECLALGILDGIYSDFDYPESMLPLTGYSLKKRRKNRTSLVEDWERVLAGMRERLLGE
jgi:hypothetical protein